MRTKRIMGVTGCVLLATTLAAGVVAGPAAAASDKPPVVKLKKQWKLVVTLSKDSVQAGVVDSR